MNKRKNIEKKIELYQAMLDGASIECKYTKGDDCFWGIANHIMDDNEEFHFGEYDYRAVYPKLTAEVFSREDCPEWANFAVIESCGCLLVYEEKPTPLYTTWVPIMGNYVKIPGIFDASDWKNSLIERKSDIHYQDYVFNCGNSRGAAVTSTNKDDITCEKCLELLKKQSVKNKLPDWCKVGAIAYCKDVSGIERVLEITSVEDYASGYILCDGTSLPLEYCCPAVYVLPTIEEIFQRSILVVKRKKLGYFSTILSSNAFSNLYLYGCEGVEMEISTLDKHFTWSDGTSIGKWVKVAE